MEVENMSEANKLIFGMISLLVILALVAGCGQTPTPGPGLGILTQGSYSSESFNPKLAISSQSFGSAAELNSFLKSHSSTNYYRRYGGVMYDMAVPTAGGMMEKAVSSDSSSGTAPLPNTAQTANDYSQTNNQVKNVDEADLIKTDGNYIYTVSGNTVFIIKAYPGQEAAIVSEITLNATPSNLFIEGDHLAVFGDFYDPVYFKAMDIRPYGGMTFFNVYDISDKANPLLLKEYKFEGNYFDARLKEGFVYFVTRTWPQYGPMPMPLYFVGGVRKEMPIDSIRYFNIPYNNPSMVTVNALSLSNPSDEFNSQTIVVEGGENLYMSESNIYITYTEYINEYQLREDITKELLSDQLTEADKALIEKIKATDDEVLSQYEKDAKILQVYYNYLNYLTGDEQQALSDKTDKLLEDRLKEYDHLEYTVINRIGVDNGRVTVGESGKVPGHIINQFSLDESDGVLRIATTLSARWSYTAKESTKSTNGVYTLDSGMKILGSMEDIAEDESIYSTRFIGDKLYMVTFRQVDPFFVIDLSDPAKPKELGQLKIPGFSRYLHPYDENTIIGIGNEATDQGRVEGLKISLFDVSDFANPKEIAKFVTEEKYATSTALYEHKAFLFSREKELLVIPAYSYDYDYKTGTQKGYNGAFVFRINKDEITLRGLIDHSAGQQAYYGAEVERSLYINELLYTKSYSLLRINKIEDLSSVKNISLATAITTVPIY
jgi:inhibitor of cysteine peptidase